MASVLVRDIPEEVVERLKSLAKRNHRSLQQELRAVLEDTVKRSSPDVFRKVAELRSRLGEKRRRFTDSGQILRRDRSR